MADDNYVLDQFDKELLKLLVENSRMKNTDIARRLNVTEGAIRKRINKLIENEFIENFTIKLNDKLLGTWAIVQVTIAGNLGPTIIREKIMNKVKGIDEIFETAGDVDLIIIFHTKGDNSLKLAIEDLRSIEGVNNTKTYVALNRTKIEQSFI